MQLVAICLLAIFPWGLALDCFTCNQGYQSSLKCSNGLPREMKETCTLPGAQCVEAVEWFQHDAFKIVRRQCWPRYNNTRPNFCQNYTNPVGRLKYCRTCNSNMCNGKVIYQPEPFLTCHN